MKILKILALTLFFCQNLSAQDDWPPEEEGPKRYTHRVTDTIIIREMPFNSAISSIPDSCFGEIMLFERLEKEHIHAFNKSFDQYIKGALLSKANIIIYSAVASAYESKSCYFDLREFHYSTEKEAQKCGKALSHIKDGKLMYSKVPQRIAWAQSGNKIFLIVTGGYNPLFNQVSDSILKWLMENDK